MPFLRAAGGSATDEFRINQSDVYALVTQAMHLSADLIPSSKSINPYPNEKPIKTPLITDEMVYKKSLELQKLLSRMIRSKKTDKKERFIAKENLQVIYTITASDSYDVMQWVLAELFHRHKESKQDPIPLYYPGIKFPKDTLKRLNALEQQLKLIQENA